MAKIESRSWLYIVVEGQEVIHSSLESMQGQEVLPEKKKHQIKEFKLKITGK